MSHEQQSVSNSLEDAASAYEARIGPPDGKIARVGFVAGWEAAQYGRPLDEVETEYAATFDELYDKLKAAADVQGGFWAYLAAHPDAEEQLSHEAQTWLLKIAELSVDPQPIPGPVLAALRRRGLIRVAAYVTDAGRAEARRVVERARENG